MRFSLTRRKALKGLAMTSVAGGSAQPAVGQEAGAPVPTAAAEQPQGVCVFFPQAVEGPYYFDPQLVRSDITDGRPGLPLALTLRVIDSGPCTPRAGARVDIWHADAGGVYSGYAGQGDARNVSTKGKSYLRGTQTTDGDGKVTFRSIYPGWYPGRTPHIHIKVFLDERTVLTGQAYFPDEISAAVYREQEPYKSRPVADTSNATDFIFKAGEREGGGTVFATQAAGAEVKASLLIAVDRTGQAARNKGGWRGLWRSFTGGN